MFAEEFKQHMARVLGGAVELRKQCFYRDSVIGYTETINGSVEKHLEHRQEVGMNP